MDGDDTGDVTSALDVLEAKLRELERELTTLADAPATRPAVPAELEPVSGEIAGLDTLSQRLEQAEQHLESENEIAQEQIAQLPPPAPPRAPVAMPADAVDPLLVATPPTARGVRDYLPRPTRRNGR